MSSTNNTTSKPFRFADLPAEIRNEIYTLAVTAPKALRVIVHERRLFDLRYVPTPDAQIAVAAYHSLSQINKETRAEVCDVFFSSNTFIISKFRADDEDHDPRIVQLPFSPPILSNVSRKMHPANKKLMKKLIVETNGPIWLGYVLRPCMERDLVYLVPSIGGCALEIQRKKGQIYVGWFERLSDRWRKCFGYDYEQFLARWETLGRFPTGGIEKAAEFEEELPCRVADVLVGRHWTADAFNEVLIKSWCINDSIEL